MPPAERQITHAPHGHILTNVHVWSRDGRRIVYDVRSDPAGEVFDGNRIETVDVLENPEAADEYRILTTPTVVREAPAPRRRVTGDLGDTAQVLAALALFPSPPKT